MSVCVYVQGYVCVACMCVACMCVRACEHVCLVCGVVCASACVSV